MYLIKLAFTACAILLVSSCIGSKDLSFDKLSNGEKLQETQQVGLDHSAFDKLLKKYVDDQGFVNYKGFKKDRSALKEYLEFLNKNAPSTKSSINEQFAYYINLYNAATVHLILENNMPSSIKDIGSTLNPVWIQDFIKVNDELFSLADIEKAVLQKMGDPRIHFAINCASYSCPKLQNTAFTAANVNSLMDKAAREFVNSNKNDLSNLSKPKLSKIFDWYKSDFTDTGVSLIDYINKYAEQPIDNDAPISYLDYDWSLNKQ